MKKPVILVLLAALTLALSGSGVKQREKKTDAEPCCMHETKAESYLVDPSINFCDQTTKFSVKQAQRKAEAEARREAQRKAEEEAEKAAAEAKAKAEAEAKAKAEEAKKAAAAKQAQAKAAQPAPQQTAPQQSSGIRYAWNVQGHTQADINAGRFVEYYSDYFAGDIKSAYGPKIMSLRAGDIITINGRKIQINGWINGNYNIDTVDMIRERAGNWTGPMIQTCYPSGGGQVRIVYGTYI